jgi:two-component sensor histidine kinase
VDPDYWVDGGVKLFTAAVSLLAAVTLWRALPRALALPGLGHLEARTWPSPSRWRSAGAPRWRPRRGRGAGGPGARAHRRPRGRERALRAMLNEKEVLLREVHHRVKNNLQVVSGLLSLQARHAAPALKEHFQESLERIQAMGRVHEQLHRSPDASSFDLGAYVEQMTPDVASAYATPGTVLAARVEVRGPARVPLDAATPLALIVNEILVNAFKHGFPDGRRTGEVVVEVERVEGGGPPRGARRRDRAAGRPREARRALHGAQARRAAGATDRRP